MSLGVALLMSGAVCGVMVACLVTIAVWWIVDQRGRRRPGRHGRVRSERTTTSSRGHRPYRGGRVRVY